ncbi:hypothetical protein BD65_1306 [Yersinia ruckeri]|nr:hypothetical protein BD65_1306 [Yersinia ruckeri]
MDSPCDMNKYNENQYIDEKLEKTEDAALYDSLGHLSCSFAVLFPGLLLEPAFQNNHRRGCIYAAFIQSAITSAVEQIGSGFYGA